MKKNGKIEFYRFLFCMIVLLFHCRKYFIGGADFAHGAHWTLFAHGAAAVEFFFIVSGFLMAKSIFKRVQTQSSAPQSRDLFTEYGTYMRRKYAGIFPMHAVGFVFAFCSALLLYGFRGVDVFNYFTDSIPNLLLIEMSGIRFRDPNHIEWYISCMLICMAILYPICRRFYYAFARYIAPIGALLLFGILIHETGSLTGVTQWMGIGYKSLFRALADIMCGTVCFELSRTLAARSFSRGQRVMLTVLEWCLLLLVVSFAALTLPVQYEVYMPMLLVPMIALAFSGQTGIPRLWNNRFFFHLGTMSLPIYIGQLTAIYLVQAYAKAFAPAAQIALATGLTIIVAYILLGANTLFNTIKRK